jgi:hypothetical protein
MKTVDKAVFDMILEKLQVSNHGIVRICEEEQISYSSFLTYLKKNIDGAKTDYMLAKDAQAEYQWDKIHELEEEMKKEIQFERNPARCNAIVQFYRTKMNNLRINRTMRAGERINVTGSMERNAIAGIAITFTSGSPESVEQDRPPEEVEENNGEH